MEQENRSNFAGTYFDKDSVLRLERWLRIVAWFLLAAYLVEAGYSVIQTLYNSLAAGYPVDFYFFLSTFSRALQGWMLFIVLQAIAKITLILLDIEDNTRRAARPSWKGRLKEKQPEVDSTLEDTHPVPVHRA
jgi:hypothetical protein